MQRLKLQLEVSILKINAGGLTTPTVEAIGSFGGGQVSQVQKEGAQGVQNG
ncbi:MAG: hypothetical protein IPO63_13145 [Bacteroidetes bacterium]|nr:hypothetical protein [Bacteroidota bacterium]